MTPTKKAVATRRITRANSAQARTAEPIPNRGPKPTKKTTPPKVTRTTRQKKTEPIKEEEEEEETISMTQQEIDAVITAQVAKIVAMKAKKDTRRKGKSVATTSNNNQGRENQSACNECNRYHPGPCKFCTIFTDLSGTIRLANDLINSQIRLGSTSNNVEVRNVDNKRRWDGNGAGNFKPRPFKRTNTSRAYNVGPSNNNRNQGNRLLCNKCKRPHQGPCKFWDISKRYTHPTRECRGPATTVNQIPFGSCFHCGGEDHWRNTCPKRNVMNNHPARGRASVITSTRNNPNHVTGTFLLNRLLCFRHI